MWPFTRRRTIQVPFETINNLQPQQPQMDDGYTIGAKDGNTVFKVKNGNTIVTMFLTPDEVYRMMRLLKASMNQDPEGTANDQPPSIDNKPMD